MAKEQVMRPKIESYAEVIAGALSLALLLLAKYLFRVPTELLGLAGTFVMALVLAIVRSILVRRGGLDQRIREAKAGNLAINPFFVCVAVAAAFLFVDAFFSFTFGSILGAALAVVSTLSGGVLSISTDVLTQTTFSLISSVGRYVRLYIEGVA